MRNVFRDHKSSTRRCVCSNFSKSLILLNKPVEGFALHMDCRLARNELSSGTPNLYRYQRMLKNARPSLAVLYINLSQALTSYTRYKHFVMQGRNKKLKEKLSLLLV
ncbi:hypothetical protein HHI36_008367 [Cryptolaemus montrouzieri]|uniref:Uncharacterized protein n=1 Tax=Cryptolaemus montrouzieri TaxID=559131 RepID=A0ABD2MSE1_9CUCU